MDSVALVTLLKTFKTHNNWVSKVQIKMDYYTLYH
jgi:hypothetical protein